MKKVSLIETITTEASETFGSSITNENDKVWLDHWIKTGEKIRDKFIAEGLHETAKSVNASIEFNRNFYHNNKV